MILGNDSYNHAFFNISSINDLQAKELLCLGECQALPFSQT